MEAGCRISCQKEVLTQQRLKQTYPETAIHHLKTSERSSNTTKIETSGVTPAAGSGVVRKKF